MSCKLGTRLFSCLPCTAVELHGGSPSSISFYQKFVSFWEAPRLSLAGKDDVGVRTALGVIAKNTDGWRRTVLQEGLFFAEAQKGWFLAREKVMII